MAFQNVHLKSILSLQTDFEIKVRLGIDIFYCWEYDLKGPAFEMLATTKEFCFY